MKRRWLLFCCAWLAACSTPPTVPTAPPTLFDDARFAPPTEPVGTDGLFSLSDEMRHYLEHDLAPRLRSAGRQRGLLEALYKRGELRLEYDATETRNAASTFAQRRGNCLSLVIMTAAFAKALDLTIDYRSADLDDTWSRRGGLFVASGHVNLTLGRRLIDHGTAVDPVALTVDFLPAEQLRGLRTQRITEQTVVAMYLNNRAAEALARGRLDDAYAWARAAIKQAPERAAAYNTLGVVYQRHGSVAMATNAFRHALVLAPRHVSAMANLAQALAAQGQRQEAALWEQRLAALESDPPFHAYQLGRQAMERGDYRSARERFTQELQRSGDSAELHHWLSLANYQLGDFDAASRELRLAAEHSASRDDRARFTAKLDWLREHARLQ